MGQNNSRPQDEPHKFFWCAIDLDMNPIQECKVLTCGHCFCESCLSMWQDGGTITCPTCRTEDQRSVANLPGFFECKGPIFLNMEPNSPQANVDIQDMMHKLIVKRAQTVR